MGGTSPVEIGRGSRGGQKGHPQEIIDFWGGAYMPQMGRPSTPLYLRGFAPRSYVKRPVHPSPDTGGD